MRLLLVGRGRMGSIVESLAPAYGMHVVGVVDGRSGPEAIAEGRFEEVDVAVDFSVPAAVPINLPQLAARRINVVIGTTGWSAAEPVLRQVVSDAGIGVLVDSNFSLGMHLFQEVVERAASRFAAHAEFGAWIHERHHDRKKDAPSGTAIAIRGRMAGAGYVRHVDVSSTRAGSFPGTHTVGFDGPSETIELTHTVRDRAVFARGALVAARWLAGRKGWFSLEDMLRDT